MVRLLYQRIPHFLCQIFIFSDVAIIFHIDGSTRIQKMSHYLFLENWGDNLINVAFQLAFIIWEGVFISFL
jgi:hypothetical protein